MREGVGEVTAAGRASHVVIHAASIYALVPKSSRRARRFGSAALEAELTARLACPRAAHRTKRLTRVALLCGLCCLGQPPPPQILTWPFRSPQPHAHNHRGITTRCVGVERLEERCTDSEGASSEHGQEQ